MFSCRSFAFAHCPLCTVGAGVGAIIAKELGMKASTIGVWIGAFAVALGLWLSNILQVGSLDAPVWPSLRFDSNTRPRPTRISLANLAKFLLILISLLSVVLPLKLYFYETGSFYLHLFGDYGSFFNRTYVYDKFLFGSIFGGLILLISPLLNKKITEFRGKRLFPYQGLMITFLLLILISLVFQL